LLNRLIPEQNMELSPVRDTVMRLPVRGQSLTSTDVALRLVPDSNRARMELKVTGEVEAVTSSTSGRRRSITTATRFTQRENRWNQ